MGKIIGSYLLKLHVHSGDEEADKADAPSNEEIKEAAIAGVIDNLGFHEVTVSLIEKTDD